MSGQYETSRTRGLIHTMIQVEVTSTDRTPRYLDNNIVLVDNPGFGHFNC